MLQRRNVKGLIKALGDVEPEIRLAAVRALGALGDARAVEPLVAILEGGGDSLLRQAAAEALGALGDARAVEPLTAALRDAVRAVRRAAAAALGRCGPPSDPNVQGWYLVALGDWDRAAALGEPAVEPLLDALKEGEEHAARALGRIGDARAVEPLAAALGSRNYHLRKAAVTALEAIGLPSDPGLLAWYAVETGDWDRVEALGAACVEPLIFRLTEYQDVGKGHTARNAAWRLRALYLSGRLSDADKRKILAVRGVMAKPHMDHSEVFEEEDPPVTEHEDYGIGVELEPDRR
jgi:HEAT repeat protein